MSLLITGGLGFIGSKLTRRLLSLGHQVRVLDSVTTQVHGHRPDVCVPEGADFVRMDVRELRDHLEVLDGIEVIYHLAAETGTAQSMYRIGHYVGVNEGGTAALLEAVGLASHRPKKVILASSRSVYGEGAFLDGSGQLVQPPPRSRLQLQAEKWELLDEEGRALTPIATPETLNFAPGSVYAATKASQELLLSSASQALDLNCVILRFQNVYGEGQSLQNPYTGILSIFFNRARQGLMLPIYEDGLETRDFVHVDDVVAAMIAAADRDLPSETVCNIGAGVATTVSELAAGLLAAAGLDVETRVTGQFRVGDIRHNFADIERARRLLGYTPRVSLAEGLERFCKWAAGEPVYSDRLDQATAELKAKGLAN
jgi:dTDP-L-rhamnose 4-epimerase